jgi:hypothetical protein
MRRKGAKMTKIQEAYRKWANLQPGRKNIPARKITYEDPKTRQMKTFVEIAHLEGDCCNGEQHFTKNENFEKIPKPDHAVCPRERAWRQYVRLRDATTNNRKVLQ